MEKRTAALLLIIGFLIGVLTMACIGCAPRNHYSTETTEFMKSDYWDRLP